MCRVSWESVLTTDHPQQCYVQIQTAVTAYFSSDQLLLFVFARRSVYQYLIAEENPGAQRQTAVTA